MKRMAVCALALLLLVSCFGFASCKSETGETVRLTFADSINVNRIQQLSGKTVEIVGYMSTLSPVSGKYLYLMNLPYQSCPYCVPNTQELSNTIAVYAKEGKTFAFYDGPINVVGTLETGNFEDENGFTYNYRIANAVYGKVDAKKASEKLALWERISNAGIASDVYAMFDYIYFECDWPNYTAKGEDGNTFYLYPSDIPFFEEGFYREDEFKEGQFSKQHASTFVPDLIRRAEKIGDSCMDDLIQIIRDGKALVDRAIAERTEKNYTYDKEKDQYTLTNGTAMMQEAQALYTRYAVWLEIFSLSK